MTSGPEPDPGPSSESDDGHPDGVPVPRSGSVSESRAEQSPATDAALDRVLMRSRELGFLGPGPTAAHIHHAAAFLPGIDDLESRQGPDRVGELTLVDLGSGGGLPGLILAVRRPGIHVVLIDAIRKRTDFLEWAVAELGVHERMEVRRGRAEELAREPDLRGSAEVVTARSFGPPAVTAECAAGFLSGPGARLLVSEPPTGSEDRWPAEGLLRLGMQPGRLWYAEGATVMAVDVITACAEGIPRRVGVPARRPLF